MSTDCATSASAAADPRASSLFWAATVARVASIAAVSVGCLVVLGWLQDVAVLTSVLPGYATMKPNTALAFIAAGTSLWLLLPPHTSRARVTGRACAAVVALIGLATLAEYLFGWQLGIDGLIFGKAPRLNQFSSRAACPSPRL